MARLKRFGEAFILILITVFATLWGNSLMARDAKITNAASKDDVVAAKTEMVEYTNCKYSENKTRADAALISSKEYTDEQIGALKNTITPQLEQMLTNQNMILDKLIKGR